MTLMWVPFMPRLRLSMMPALSSLRRALTMTLLVTPTLSATRLATTTPSELHDVRFGGVEGSAYLVGGLGVNYEKYGDIVLAPIRTGVGARLGANIGYLKYTPRPTWNPF